ncbi:MAG: glutamate 5-kinase [Acetanaerobacterium sp.]
MCSMKDAKRIVVKVGTSTLAYDTGRMNIRKIERLVKVLADIKNAGREVVLVSSGAIGVGAGKLGLAKRPSDIPSKQAAAAVGQCELMYTYDKLFGEYNHTVAQVLLTRDVIDDAARRKNVENTFCRLLEMGCIPIVNENDTVATEEIEFGDNDTLSALVASVCGAQALIVLTDIDGLYTGDPRIEKNACLIERVTDITDELCELAGGAGSSLGTGGMVTKLNAARIAMQNDITMSIVNGATPEAIYDLIEGKCAGTLFMK